MTQLKTIIAFLLLPAFVACGYHLLGKEVNLPGGVKKVYVETARNKTMESGLEQIFTQKLMEHLRADGRVNLVNKSEAEAILRSELIQSEVHPLAFDKFGRVILQEIEISANVMLIATRENKTLWNSGIIREREQYPVSDDFLRNDQLRRGALIQASQRLSRTIVEMLTSDF